MISSAAPNHESPQPYAGATPGRATRRVRTQPSSDEIGPQASPFGSLLLTFADSPVVAQARGGVASSFGVFDSGDMSGRAQRTSALRDGAAGTGGEGLGRYGVDRTGVDVRRELRAEGRGADTGSARSAEPSDQNRGGTIDEPSRSTLRGDGDRRPAPGFATERLAGAERSGASRNTQSSRTQGIDPVAERMSGVDPTANPEASYGGAAVSPTSSPSASASSDVAHELGRTLGAGRVGEVESPRAPTAASNTQDARSASPSPQRGRKAARSPSGKSGSPPSTAKGTALEPTPFDRLVRSIRMNKGTLRSSAKMILDPPELGKVLVDVSMVGDTLEVSVRAETLEARQLLQDRMAKLREALVSQGIEIDRLEVIDDWPGKATTGQRDFDRSDDPFVDRNPRRPTSGRNVAEPVGQLSGKQEDGQELVAGNPVAERRIDLRI